MPLRRAHTRGQSWWRAPGGAPVGKQAGMPLGGGSVLVCGTWRCCNGWGARGAPGTPPPALPLLVAGLCRCCSGRGAGGASPIPPIALLLLMAGTCRCCSGLGAKDVREIEIPLYFDPADMAEWARSQGCPWPFCGGLSGLKSSTPALRGDDCRLAIAAVTASESSVAGDGTSAYF